MEILWSSRIAKNFGDPFRGYKCSVFGVRMFDTTPEAFVRCLFITYLLYVADLLLPQ